MFILLSFSHISLLIVFKYKDLHCNASCYGFSQTNEQRIIFGHECLAALFFPVDYLFIMLVKDFLIYFKFCSAATALRDAVPF